MSSQIIGYGDAQSDIVLCPEVKKALTHAVTLAVQQVAQNYEDKVINYTQPVLLAEVAIMLWLTIMGAKEPRSAAASR